MKEDKPIKLICEKCGQEMVIVMEEKKSEREYTFWVYCPKCDTVREKEK